MSIEIINGGAGIPANTCPPSHGACEWELDIFVIYPDILLPHFTGRGGLKCDWHTDLQPDCGSFFPKIHLRDNLLVSTIGIGVVAFHGYVPKAVLWIKKRARCETTFRDVLFFGQYVPLFAPHVS